MKDTPLILKIAAKPFLVLILLIGVSLFGFSKAFYQIGSLKEELTKATKDENILKSKLNILSETGESAKTDANSAVSFLPEENPALLALYQLRVNAISSGIFLSNLKISASSKDPNGFMKVPISFDTVGPLEQIINFANMTKTSSPNIWIDSVELNFAGENLQASINATSFWVPFPTKIPALTEPITTLDASERDILLKIASYSQPSFITLNPEVPRENTNPFGL